jgi:hypothetical protein
MNQLRKFEDHGPNDPVRLLEVWEERVCRNVNSARMVVVIGFPAKHVEEYPLDIHRVGWSR